MEINIATSPTLIFLILQLEYNLNILDDSKIIFCNIGYITLRLLIFFKYEYLNMFITLTPETEKLLKVT